MIVVNAIGKPCPIPVIEAKKAIAQLPKNGGKVAVRVDDVVACKNLEKMAEQKGYFSTVTVLNDSIFEVVLEVHSKPVQEQSSKKLVVAISSQFMGKGNDELGAMLLKSFIFSLTELEKPPYAVLFYNGGVHLTTTGSMALEDLKQLEQLGSSILSCGACLNFYEKIEQLQVGNVSNMFSIVEIMTDADQVIQI